MTGRVEKTVFISYRRTNFWTALAVYKELHSNGFDVFFDYKNIPSGNFEQVITENVKSRAHFIVILSPSALERCHEPGDWLRREIELAIRNHRNVIPLMMEGFDFGSATTAKALTGELANLKLYNAIGIPAEYFDDAMSKLRSDRFLNRPLESVAQPISDVTKNIAEEQKFAANKAAPVETSQLTAEEWFERGYIFDKAKNHTESIRCYTESIRLNPDFAIAYGNRGFAIIESHGDLENALTDLDEAIRLDPNNAVHYNNRGRLHSMNGNVDKAIADYDQSIRCDSNYHHPYSNRGFDRHKKGDINGAIADFDMAIHIEPDYEDAYVGRGNALRDKGDLEVAISDYSHAIRANPNGVAAYYNRGITFSMKDDNINALVDLQKAKEIEPQDAATLASLVRVLKSLGRFEESKEPEQIARRLIQKENEYDQACARSHLRKQR